MYPLLTNSIKQVRYQPLYSDFKIEYGDRLYPLAVNETAEQIMLLSNGVNSIEKIHAHLSNMYQEDLSVVRDLVSEFLENAIRYNHISLINDPLVEAKNIEVYGSRDYWTPTLLTIELTDMCPLNCKHCYVSKNKKLMMDEDLIKKIIYQIKSLKIEQVQLTGGEPLLHPHFFEILTELINAGVFVHVFTSGFVYDQNIINRFDEFDKRKLLIQVSIDGLKHYHDAFRRKSGSFERAIEFLKLMNSNGFNTVVGLTVIDQPYEELSELCDLCELIGVNTLRIGAVSSRGEAKESNLMRTIEETEYVLNMKKRLAKNKSSEHFKVALSDSDEINNNSLYSKNCGWGQIILKVSAEGNVYPCPLSDLLIGNLKVSTIENILKEKSRLFEQIEIPNQSICNKCESEILCSNCVIEAILYSEKYNSCQWLKKNATLIQQITGE